MENVRDAITKAAADVADLVNAKAIVVLTETGETYKSIKNSGTEIPIIAATPNKETFEKLQENKVKTIFLRTRSSVRREQVRYAIAAAINQDLLEGGEKVVGVAGKAAVPGGTDYLQVYDLEEAPLELEITRFLGEVERGDPEVIETIIEIALELGREGREGQPVGTAFIVGDSGNVLKRSTQLILNPFLGYPSKKAKITDPVVGGSIKEFAQLDGVFVVQKNGVVRAAGTYLNVETEGLELPSGLGGRHIAAAGITRETGALAVVVSKSGGVVRVFDEGKIVLEIDPKTGMARYLK